MAGELYPVFEVTAPQSAGDSGLNRSGFAGGCLVKVGRHRRSFQRVEVKCFCFRRRDIPDWLKKPAVVEPVDPFQRRELDGFHRPPRPAPTIRSRPLY